MAPASGIETITYVFEGSGSFKDASPPQPAATEVAGGVVMSDLRNRSLVLFDSGDEIRVRADREGIRFLLVSGQPLREPVAWHGPIVMNTEEEIRQAFEEYRTGRFLRH